MSRIFVGNVLFSCTEGDLQQWFEAQGFEISHVELIHDRLAGQPRGFGFVELRFAWKTQTAIESLHQKEFGVRSARRHALIEEPGALEQVASLARTWLKRD